MAGYKWRAPGRPQTWANLPEPKTRRRPRKPCGTVQAYWVHKKYREPVDDGCRLAYNAYQTERRGGTTTGRTNRQTTTRDLRLAKLRADLPNIWDLNKELTQIRAATRRQNQKHQAELGNAA